jgi:hypothetical protein
MAQMAREAGYFRRSPNPRELASAIRDDLSGQKLYARAGTAGSPEARAAYDAAASERERLRGALKQLGLDIDSTTNDDLRSAVSSIAASSGDVPAVRSDFTSDAIDRAKATAAELDRQATHEERTAADAERDLRSQYESRMDQPVYVQAEDGTVRTVAARELFDDLSQDDKLVNEFGNCIGEG